MDGAINLGVALMTRWNFSIPWRFPMGRLGYMYRSMNGWIFMVYKYIGKYTSVPWIPRFLRNCIFARCTLVDAFFFSIMIFVVLSSRMREGKLGLMYQNIICSFRQNSGRFGMIPFLTYVWTTKTTCTGHCRGILRKRFTFSSACRCRCQKNMS